MRRKRTMRTTAAALLLAILAAAPGLPVAQEKAGTKPEEKAAATGQAAKPDKAEEARAQKQEIDAMASAALDRLFAELPGSRELHGQSKGYAVFDNTKFAFILSGGGGAGVAVSRPDGERTYMKMGTAGIGLGLGGQKYQVVFMFETQEAFDKFVTKGWMADAGANAVAGAKGANALATFSNGIAIFQMTEKGLLLQADIAGTKYWKNKKLN